MYGIDGRWAEQKMALAVHLARNNVPPVQLLSALKEQAKKYARSQGMGENTLEMLELRVRDTTKAFAQAVMTSFDLPGTKAAGGDAGLWKAESAKEAVGWWVE